MNDALYREEILEHYHDPHNFGKLEKFDNSSKQLNPFCGDEIEIFLKFESNTISEISFLGKGCVLSMASASILTDFIKDKDKERVQKVSEQELLSLLDIEVSETRKKCALLPLAVLQDCL